MIINLLYLFILVLNPFTSVPTSPASDEEDSIIWSNNRRLTWDDFESPADENDPLHAMTSTNIAVKANCSGNTMRFDVKCVFMKKDSWTKNRLSKRLLDHEQVHFDLTELHARLLRQKLNASAGVCGANRLKLDAIVEKNFTEWKKEQDLYDKTTNHGLLEEKQKEWIQNTANRLAQLDAYSYRTYALK